MKYLLITLVLLLFLNFNKVYSDVLPNDMFSSIEKAREFIVPISNNNSGIYYMLAFCTSRK